MKTLYCGLDPDRYGIPVVHLPLIEIRERGNLELYFQQLPYYSDVILTSRTAVELFVQRCRKLELPVHQRLLVVGRATEELLRGHGLQASAVATIEQAEGMLPFIFPHNSYFYPHSSGARGVLKRALSGIDHLAFALYDTVAKRVEMPQLELFDKVVLTSPSTVRAFLENVGYFPKHLEYKCIGPITQAELIRLLRR